MTYVHQDKELDLNDGNADSVQKTDIAAKSPTAESVFHIEEIDVVAAESLVVMRT